MPNVPACLAAAVVASVAPSDANAQEHPAPPRYRIIDLGVVGDATASQAFGVSPRGAIVVGRDLGPSGNPAYQWTRATGAVALPNLPGRAYAQANAVNDGGLAVGTSTTTVFGAGALPVRWTDGAVTPLTLPAGQTVGRANAVNQAGVAAGSVGADVLERAAIFEGAATTLVTATTSTGRYMLYANGINDVGWVVGSGADPHDAAVNVALLYDSVAGTMTDLGALPGDNGALAFGVSNGGFVVGSSMRDQGPGRPFMWTRKTGMVEIPLPPQTSQGAAYAVNTEGWAVGNGAGLYSVPFLHAGGKTYPLYTLLPPHSGWDLRKNTSSSALGITDLGDIVGTGVHDGQTHGYLMVLKQGGDGAAP